MPSGTTQSLFHDLLWFCFPDACTSCSKLARALKRPGKVSIVAVLNFDGVEQEVQAAKQLRLELQKQFASSCRQAKQKSKSKTASATTASERGDSRV